MHNIVLEKKAITSWHSCMFCLGVLKHACAHAAKKYSAFLASETVIKQIPRLLGPGLNKAGKFPALVSHAESLEGKVCALNCPLLPSKSVDTSNVSLWLTFSCAVLCLSLHSLPSGHAVLCSSAGTHLLKCKCCVSHLHTIHRHVYAVVEQLRIPLWHALWASQGYKLNQAGSICMQVLPAQQSCSMKWYVALGACTVGCSCACTKLRHLHRRQHCCRACTQKRLALETSMHSGTVCPCRSTRSRHPSSSS